MQDTDARQVGDPHKEVRRTNVEHLSVGLAFHKRFMVVTKMVDLIAESLFHELGEDLYKQGANIAMSNMLFYCMPAFCGMENTDRFLRSFVDLIRYRTPDHAQNFYDAGRQMVGASTNDDFKHDLYLFTEPAVFGEWFDSIGDNALDPAIPALFQHIATWGVRLTGRFRVIHDQSKPVLASQKGFEDMMALGNEPPALIGYDRRKFKFPLQASSLEQGDSLAHPQLQVADICAGAVAYFLKCHVAGESNELADLVRHNALSWVIDAIIPTKSISPSELGTDEAGGTNPVAPMVKHLRQRKRQGH